MFSGSEGATQITAIRSGIWPLSSYSTIHLPLVPHSLFSTWNAELINEGWVLSQKYPHSFSAAHISGLGTFSQCLSLQFDWTYQTAAISVRLNTDGPILCFPLSFYCTLKMNGLRVFTRAIRAESVLGDQTGQRSHCGMSHECQRPFHIWDVAPLRIDWI